MLLEQRTNDAHHLGMTMIIEPILLENRLLILVVFLLLTLIFNQC